MNESNDRDNELPGKPESCHEPEIVPRPYPPARIAQTGQGESSAESFQNAEIDQFWNSVLEMSPSGQVQFLRSTMIPEGAELFESVVRSEIQSDPAEAIMLGNERKLEKALAQDGLLEVYRRIQQSKEFRKARESCKRAFLKLASFKRLLKSVFPSKEFDEAYFYVDFVPNNFQRALIEHQGTIADAAGRGDLEFFKRLYKRWKKRNEGKAGGFYKHWLCQYWLHGFFWLMPDTLAATEAAKRLDQMLRAAKGVGLQPRMDRSQQTKLAMTSTSSGIEQQRTRFREAVKALGLYSHRDAPLLETRIPNKGEPNESCYVWKSGWLDSLCKAEQ